MHPPSRDDRRTAQAIIRLTLQPFSSQTPVSISTYLTHMDPEFFPDPHAFRPERWLEAKQSGFPLHKYLVAFSRGHRQCLGIRHVLP